MFLLKELFLEEGFSVEISTANNIGRVDDFRVSTNIEVRLIFEDRTPDIVGRCKAEKRYGKWIFFSCWWETLKDTPDSPWSGVIRNRMGKGGISFCRGYRAIRRWTDISEGNLKDIEDLILQAFEE